MLSSKSKDTIICKFCNGYYDFGSEQPVCSTCHAFLYEYSSPALTAGRHLDEKEASNDSGNEEPDRGSDLFSSVEWFDALDCIGSIMDVHQPTLYPSGCHQQQHPCTSIRSPFLACPLRSPPQHQNQSLLRRQSITHSSASDANLRSGTSNRSPSLEELPYEILVHIFKTLDDISLWTLRQVSSRCRQVIDAEIPDQQWANFVHLRWPLFNPRYRIPSWRLLYLNLMESVTCRFCLERLRFPVLFHVEAPNVRFRRIVQEIKNLCTDPPYGIQVLALDKETYSHCLAGIEGPPQSPYQGGMFYVHVLVPDSYPIRPPVIRFLTRILHPNISFHGDVGMDCIQHNWSLALTLEKLLISVQSLLTDPYTRVCMEPAVGALYNKDFIRFEELAKLWTWKYACHDYLSVDFVASMVLPNYIEQMSSCSSTT